MTYCLDTNVVVYLLAGKLDPGLPVGSYFVSVVTELELLSYPAMTGPEEAAILGFLSEIEVIDLSIEIKREAVRLRKESGLKLPDAIVCATAIAKNATLLTNDDRLLGVTGVTSARVVVARP